MRDCPEEPYLGCFYRGGRSQKHGCSWLGVVAVRSSDAHGAFMVTDPCECCTSTTAIASKPTDGVLLSELAALTLLLGQQLARIKAEFDDDNLAVGGGNGGLKVRSESRCGGRRLTLRIDNRLLSST